MAEDKTFTGTDVIRLYKEHLDREEREEVEEFFLSFWCDRYKTLLKDTALFMKPLISVTSIRSLITDPGAIGKFVRDVSSLLFRWGALIRDCGLGSLLDD